MSETKMELKIVFENYEDLNRKLYSLLYREDRRCCFPAKDQYKIEEIKNKIKMYELDYKDNIFDLIKNGKLISRALNYTQLINKLSEITWNKECIIVQNPAYLSEIFVFI